MTPIPQTTLVLTFLYLLSAFAAANPLVVERGITSQSLANQIKSRNAQWVCHVFYGMYPSTTTVKKTVYKTKVLKTTYKTTTTTTLPASTTTLVTTASSTTRPLIETTVATDPVTTTIYPSPATTTVTAATSYVQVPGEITENPGSNGDLRRRHDLPSWLRPYSSSQIREACRIVKYKTKTKTSTKPRTRTSVLRVTKTSKTRPPRSTLTTTTTVVTTIPSLVTVVTTPTTTTEIPLVTATVVPKYYLPPSTGMRGVVDLIRISSQAVTVEDIGGGYLTYSCATTCWNTVDCIAWYVDRDNGGRCNIVKPNFSANVVVFYGGPSAQCSRGVAAKDTVKLVKDPTGSSGRGGGGFGPCGVASLQ